MKIKGKDISIGELPYYIEAYLIDLPCLMIHELSHWIISFVTFLVGINDIPRISITRWYHTVSNNDDACTSISYGWCANNTFITNGDKPLLLAIVCAGPAITVLLIVIFLPWYMSIFCIAKFHLLFMSASDIKVVIDYIKSFKSKKDG